MHWPASWTAGMNYINWPRDVSQWSQSVNTVTHFKGPDQCQSIQHPPLLTSCVGSSSISINYAHLWQNSHMMMPAGEICSTNGVPSNIAQQICVLLHNAAHAHLICISIKFGIFACMIRELSLKWCACNELNTCGMNWGRSKWIVAQPCILLPEFIAQSRQHISQLCGIYRLMC